MSIGLIRVREFAEKCGCTPQNIYLHMKNYAAELEGHIHEGRRGQMLDAFAQDFIRDVMYPKELATDTTVQKLQEEIAELRASLFQASTKSLELASRLAETEGERDRALLDAGQYQKLLVASQEAEAAQKAELIEANEKAAAAAERAAELDRLLGEVQAERDAAVAKNNALKNRGLLARIFRKGE